MKNIQEVLVDYIFERNHNQIFSAIEDEIVILNIETSEYISNNKVGSSIWGFLEEPHTFNDIIEYLVSIYDVSLQECQQDTEPFLVEMINAGLIIARAND